MYRVGQKTGPKTHDHNSVNSKRILEFFFTRRFLDKFAANWISKIPPHLAYVSTLPCETFLMSAKQTNDKLQGIVSTYLRCGGVVNNQIKKVHC